MRRKTLSVVSDLFLAALLALGIAIFVQSAKADIVTEFGVGYKLPNSSALLLPWCNEASIIDPGWPENPRPYPQVYSCGGDQPAFIGWPVAWESDWKGPWRVRAGWFHYSNWFDGGRQRETHMDIAAVTATFNWTRWGQK